MSIRVIWTESQSSHVRRGPVEPSHSNRFRMGKVRHSCHRGMARERPCRELLRPRLFGSDLVAEAAVADFLPPAPGLSWNWTFAPRGQLVDAVDDDQFPHLEPFRIEVSSSFCSDRARCPAARPSPSDFTT